MAPAQRLNPGPSPFTIQHPFGGLRGSHAENSWARSPIEGDIHPRVRDEDDQTDDRDRQERTSEEGGRHEEDLGGEEGTGREESAAGEEGPCGEEGSGGQEGRACQEGGAGDQTREGGE